ncbi:hypothetical protein SESBI_10453 [Sesbania bispinosa]|nr:hypothetical protein SESBI_10453 [Sesbania bispinosa]
MNDEDDLVFQDDDMTWGDIANVAGVHEPSTYTRGKEVIEEGDEGIEEEEGKEIYNFCTCESVKEEDIDLKDDDD